LRARPDGNLLVNVVTGTILIDATSGTILSNTSLPVHAVSEDAMFASANISAADKFAGYTNTIVKTDFSFNIQRTYHLKNNYSAINIAIDGNGVFYVTAKQRSEVFLFGFEMDNPNPLWQIHTPGSDNIPLPNVAIIGDGTLFWAGNHVAQCADHGACHSSNKTCSCNSKWGGKDCSLCLNTCSNHGSCNSDGDCVCVGNTQGYNCSLCKENWGGQNCLICTKTCSGHGTCDAAGDCHCTNNNWSWTQYHGDDCSQTSQSVTIIVTIIGAVVVAVGLGLVVIAFLRRRRTAGYQQIEEKH